MMINLLLIGFLSFVYQTLLLKKDFEWAVETASIKKKIDCSCAEFITIDEGLCVQMMHIGSFDDEPASVALMDKYIEENGYINDLTKERLHHEIYLSDEEESHQKNGKQSLDIQSKKELNMNEKIGEVFSITKDNEPIPGCTTSKAVNDTLTYFSLARNTDISAEIYPYYKMIYVLKGQLEVYGNNGYTKVVKEKESFITFTDIPMGIRTKDDVIYTEILIRRMDYMNEMIKPGEVFKLAELLPYSEGKIINMDIVHNEKMKFVVMAFDEGTGLTEHAAPGEAIIFALDGEGIISYEGKDHVIKAGENFCFAKGGMHAVKASKRFKMALLLTLE